MQADHRSPHAKLADWWAATQSGITASNTDPACVIALEQRYDITLPSEFRGYVLSSCPKDDPSWDNELTNWWPISRMKTIPDEYQHAVTAAGIRKVAHKAIFFADYSIWCWAWAICCDDGEHRGKVAAIGGGDRFVADSFGEFVDRYLADPPGYSLSPA